MKTGIALRFAVIVGFLGAQISFTTVFAAEFAAEFEGGTLKNGDNIIGAVCEERSPENGICTAYRIQGVVEATGECVWNYGVLRTTVVKEAGRDTYAIAAKSINRKYARAATVGVGTALLLAFDLEGERKPAKVALVVPLVTVGFAVDAVKAPLVGIAFLVHKSTDLTRRKKIIGLVKFLVDADQKTKMRKINDRFLYALQRAVAANTGWE